nr:MAG TPA: hypothetical protein [Bacteriophage sp.]
MMATSTRHGRALQVWTYHGYSTQGDPGAVVINGPHQSGGGRPAGRAAA